MVGRAEATGAPLEVWEGAQQCRRAPGCRAGGRAGAQRHPSQGKRPPAGHGAGALGPWTLRAEAFRSAHHSVGPVLDVGTVPAPRGLQAPLPRPLNSQRTPHPVTVRLRLVNRPGDGGPGPSHGEKPPAGEAGGRKRRPCEWSGHRDPRWEQGRDGGQAAHPEVCLPQRTAGMTTSRWPSSWPWSWASPQWPPWPPWRPGSASGSARAQVGGCSLFLRLGAATGPRPWPGALTFGPGAPQRALRGAPGFAYSFDTC